MDCQPPVNSSFTLPASPVGNPTADQIDDVIATPQDKTHVDPSSPAELPPSPPDPDHYDMPHSDISPGSVLDNIMRGHNCPWSPSTPFEFPFYNHLALHPRSPAIPDSINDKPLIPTTFGQRHSGGHDTSGLWDQGQQAVNSSNQSTDWSHMDAGTKICLTGDLSILADVVGIPLLPIMVALNGNGSSLDDCCTKKGYIPLTLSDGTIHWQLCYYFANAVEKNHLTTGNSSFK